MAGAPDESDEEVIGPMPASAPSATSASTGAQALIEREERQRQAAAQEQAAQTKATSARPDWMVTMPSPHEQGPVPPGALRARGFQQATSRAWRAGPEDPAEAHRLWTETPEQKRERGQTGAEPRVDPAWEREQLDKERIAARDAALREKVQAHNAERSQSLVEEHKARRLNELRRRDETRHRSRHDDSDRREHHHRHHHHRSKSHRSHRHEDRSHGHHRERDRSRSPVRKTRAQREEEDRERNGEYAAPLFDKDKVLGKGARLMDERARSRSIADARQLASRFATGSSGAFL